MCVLVVAVLTSYFCRRKATFAKKKNVTLRQKRICTCILDNSCTMGSCIVVLKDECIPMPMDVGHTKRLGDIVSVVEPKQPSIGRCGVDLSSTSPWQMWSCPPSHGDPSPTHETSTSSRVRSWLEAGIAPQFDAKAFAAHVENGDCEFYGLTLGYFVLKLKSHNWLNTIFVCGQFIVWMSLI